MEELSNALVNQLSELVTSLELYFRREAMVSNASALDNPFQQFSNPYSQEQDYFSAQDQFHFQNSDLVLDSYNSAYGDDRPYFQQQEASSYPQPYAHMPYSDFQQEEHGYYPQNQFLEGQQWSCYDTEPSTLSAATFAAIMEALQPSTGSSLRHLETAEDSREEERNALAMVDQEQGLSQEAEIQETSTSAKKFRDGEEKKQEETEQGKVSRLCLSLHTEQELPLQSKHGLHLSSEQDTLNLQAELGLPLQSALFQHENQQQKEEEKQEKKLNAYHDLSLVLKGKEEKAIDDLTCEDLDLLLQEVHHLLQHGASEIQEKREKEFFPCSSVLLRIKNKEVEDFTCADFDILLHEESHVMAGQNQLQEEKQEEEKTIAPSLQAKEAAEPHYHPQDTTPRQKEEEAAYPFSFKCLLPDFELTLNHFSLAMNVFISGDRLQTQQLNLNIFCKLQLIASFGEVHKRGARGDGVLWCIKVHPP